MKCFEVWSDELKEWRLMDSNTGKLTNYKLNATKGLHLVYLHLHLLFAWKYAN